MRAVRWRPQRWWSSREPSLYSAPTGRPPSTFSTPSVKGLAPSPQLRHPGAACVGPRRRRGAGLAGYGAADSLCVRGAGLGAQAARGPREPHGFQSGGKPRGSPRVHLLPADSRWAPRSAAQRGERAGPGSLPLKGPRLWPARGGRGSESGRWGQTGRRVLLRGPGDRRARLTFPAVVISTGCSGWERERFSRSFLPGRWELSLTASPQPQTPAAEGHFLGVGS